MKSVRLGPQAGDLVKCEKCEVLKYPFIGKVHHIYCGQAVVEVLNYHFKDRSVLSQSDYYVTVPVFQLRGIKITKCQRIKREDR